MNFSLNSKYKTLDDVKDLLSKNGGKIDLGCGFYKPEGFIGLDNLYGAGAQIENQLNGPDIFLDLNKEKIPFDDNSCVEVRTSHFLEHSKVDHIIKESFRVLKPGGQLLITVPYANSAEGMYPGHSIFFTEKWFYNNINFNNFFVITNEEYKESDDWKKTSFLLRTLIPFNTARKHFFNCCNEMTLYCKPKK